MRRTILISLSAALSVSMLVLAGCKKDDAAAGTTGTTGTPGTTGTMGTTGTTGGGGAMTLDAYAAKAKEFHDKGNDLGKKLGEEMQAAMGGATDPNAMQAVLPKVGEVCKKYKDQLVPMINEMKALTPPAELAEWHSLKAQQADEGLKMFDEMIAACEKSDMTAFQTASQKMSEEGTKMNDAAKEALKKAGFNADKYEADGTLVKG